MCGIFGIFNYKNGMNVNPTVLNDSISTMKHRGPDDSGSFFSGDLGLGFRRLSIIDLSSAGHQPMMNSREDIVVVFNGEIYNFPDLRKELEGYGYIFFSKSDTEVIIHGYDKWGEDVLNHLNGMFGLAIWDNKQKKLMIARDKAGIKLVYFTITNNGVIFGSEIKSITSALYNCPGVDVNSLALFLQYRFTPSPYTIYEGIQKLASGEKMVFKADTPPRKELWYSYTPRQTNNNISEKDAENILLELYSKAMKRHLISDVPVGILLSGGMDSAMLLALMNKYGSNWDTFTVGYGDSFHDDELVDASRTAEIFGVKNHQILLSRQEFEKTLPKVITSLEEPIASSSIVPMYHVCSAAKEHVTVAMVGQGPDELFGGYTRHLGIRYGSIWRSIPDFIRKPLKSGMKSFSKIEKIRRGLYSLDNPEQNQRYLNTLSLLSPDIISELFKSNTSIGSVKMNDAWNIYGSMASNLDELGGFQFYELRSTLPDELLMYSDKLSMAHSLELRVPYLDQDLTEWVETLPSRLKVKFLNRKYLHKKVCSNFLPKEIINRKKRSFAVNVVDDWFDSSFEGKFYEYLCDPQSFLYNYMNYNNIQNLYKEHANHKQDYHKILFSLVVFEEWMRTVKRIV